MSRILEMRTLEAIQTRGRSMMYPVLGDGANQVGIVRLAHGKKETVED